MNYSLSREVVAVDAYDHALEQVPHCCRCDLIGTVILFADTAFGYVFLSFRPVMAGCKFQYFGDTAIGKTAFFIK
jgi:hypothetical protein